VPILGDIREAAKLAEQLGLDSVWSTDHLIASAPILDSTAVLGVAAGVTDRIRIGYGALIPSPPILIGGEGIRARRRAAEFGEGWITIGTPPEEIAKHRAQLAELVAGHGRPAPYSVVVSPPLSVDREQALDQLAAYAAAGTRRVVLPPSGSDWREAYETAAAFREKLGD
jgi:alkanesulfonate monooxygenase SsuD/methylene tetrahydromethanopterin reductase-like flavin-dependent oxidoreductase (luciferase family)